MINDYDAVDLDNRRVLLIAKTDYIRLFSTLNGSRYSDFIKGSLFKSPEERPYDSLAKLIHELYISNRVSYNLSNTVFQDMKPIDFDETVKPFSHHELIKFLWTLQFHIRQSHHHLATYWQLISGLLYSEVRNNNDYKEASI